MSNNRQVASKLAQEAARLVGTVRGQQHGDVEPSFRMIAELWSVYINHSTSHAANIETLPPIHLTAHDALQMMSLLKKVRSVYGDQANAEHYVDDIGYTSLAGMLATPEVTYTAEEPEPAPVAEEPLPIPEFLNKGRD